jgi:hypothetical protein
MCFILITQRFGGWAPSLPVQAAIARRAALCTPRRPLSAHRCIANGHLSAEPGSSIRQPAAEQWMPRYHSFPVLLRYDRHSDRI